MFSFFFHVLLIQSLYLQSNINLLGFNQTAAQRPILPHIAARPAADVEGGGGQRKVPAENSDSQPRSSLASVRAFSGRDPSVSLPSGRLSDI